MRRIAALLLILAAAPAWGRVCNSRATGNWSATGNGTSTGTWASPCNVTVPGAGDVVSIWQNVTVDTPVTVGMSPPDYPTTQLTVDPTGGGATGGTVPTGSGIYVAYYTQVDTNGAEGMIAEGNPRSAATGSAAFSVTLGNIPRITFPSRPAGIASYNLYVSNATSANGVVYLQATGITGTTYDLTSFSTTTPYQQTSFGVFVAPGGTLTIASTLKIQGHFTSWGNGSASNVVWNAGSVLEMDSSVSGVRYQIIESFTSKTTTFTANGTSGSHVTIRSNAGGPNAFFNQGGGTSFPNLNFSYTDFVRIGDSTHHLVDMIGGDTNVIDHCTFDANSGPVYSNVAFTSGQGFTITNNKFSQTGQPLYLRISGAGTGTRTFTGNSFAASAGSPTVYFGNGMVITDNFFGQQPQFFLTSVYTTWNNNFIRQIPTNVSTHDCPTAGSGPLSTYGSASNTYLYNDCTLGNPHMVTPQASGTFDGWILEYRGPFTFDPGDGFYVSASSGYTLVVQNSIILPIAGSTYPSSNLANISSGNTLSAYHNTFQYGTQGGLVMGDINYGAGIYTNFKSNLGWDDGANCPASGSGTLYPCKLVSIITSPTYPNVAATTSNELTGGNADYNYAWNPATGYAKATQWTSTAGYGYDSNTTVAPGQHDIDQFGGSGPNFVDKTRNLGKWAVARGSTASDNYSQVTDAFTYLFNDPTLISSSLLPYVRGGFAPQNSLLHNAAHDGTDIGAVAWQSAPLYPSTLMPIIW